MKGERGTTLLETMVALAIGAIVLGTLSRAVVRVADARSRSMTRTDRIAAAERFLDRLRREIESGTSVGQLPAFTLGADDGTRRWTITTRIPTDHPTDDVRLVTYRQHGHAIARQERSRFRPAAEAGDPETTVIDQIQRVSLRAFDGVEWTAHWSRRRLPVAIEASVTVDAGDGLPETLVTTVAPVTAEAGH